MQLQSPNAAPRSSQELAERFCSVGKPNARTLQLFAQEQRGLIHQPLPRCFPSPSPLIPRHRCPRPAPLTRGGLGLSAAD